MSELDRRNFLKTAAASATLLGSASVAAGTAPRLSKISHQGRIFASTIGQKARSPERVH